MSKSLRSCCSGLTSGCLDCISFVKSLGRCSTGGWDVEDVALFAGNIGVGSIDSILGSLLELSTLNKLSKESSGVDKGC